MLIFFSYDIITSKEERFMLSKIKSYTDYLISEEKSTSTIHKYIHDITEFVKWLAGKEISKELTIEYKQILMEQYTVKTVNSVISSLNSFFIWMTLRVIVYLLCLIKMSIFLQIKCGHALFSQSEIIILITLIFGMALKGGILLNGKGEVGEKLCCICYSP